MDIYTFLLGLWKEKVHGKLDAKTWMVICGWWSYESFFSKISSRNIDLSKENHNESTQKKVTLDLNSGSATYLPPRFGTQRAMPGLSPHSGMCPLSFLSQTQFLWPAICFSLPAFSSKQILTLREGGVPS